VNLAATSFCLANALACARACADSYTRETIKVGHTEILVVDHNNAVIIAFRGTDSAKDWLTDARFLRRTLCAEPNGDMVECHSGFMSKAGSVLVELFAQLRYSVADRPVFVTGHSLGGALAMLCALEMSRQKVDLAQIYTFGQPRVGNAAFKRLYERELPQTFRVVYQEDVVARVPHFPRVLDPYRHAGVEVFINSAGAVEFNPSFWRRATSDMSGAWQAFRERHFKGAANRFSDHKISNYVKALEKFL
jgi:pimeloyl-ACP methyl ester carboxylesterase